MEKTIYTTGQKTLLRLLREAREQAGITQDQLAERLGETQSFVSKCERGERRLDALELRQFCKAIGMPFLTFCKALDQTLE
jgi:transcriptional regulator with XRE-family HTH domain